MAPDSPSSIDHDRWFAEEVRPHESKLKAYLRGSFPGVHDVDDLVQESYLRLWRRQLAAPIRGARSFLYKIARHLAIDAVRHDACSPIDRVADLAALDVLDTGVDAAEAACVREKLALLLEAIDALPPRCREVVILRKLHGLSQKDIARQLGITERTVEVHGTRGLDRLEQFLRERGMTGRDVTCG